MIEPRSADDDALIVVKFMAKKLTAAATQNWRRQLPGSENRWGRCRFVFDADCRDYDWLVAYEDLSPVTGERFSERIEPLACPLEHTILITGEPSSVKSYSSDYCRQYHLLITTQEAWAIDHRNILRTQTAYPWFYGRGDDHLLTYDQITANQPTEKSGLISTVCSAKRRKGFTLHNARLDFTNRLENEMPDLVRYGKGVRYLNDKAEVLDGYRYHVAIENDSVPDYFTEKLQDPFLGLTLPFYFGCTNAADYFPAESFIPIDIFDFAGSLDRIRNAIAHDEYEKRLPHIREARRRVLDEHNIFALLSREIEKRHDPDRQGTSGASIYSRRALRDRSIRDFARTIYEKYRLKRLQAKHRRTF